ncbi:hypothetical protein FVP74_07430 [Microbacterium saccharophilum]|uniref:Uncharacterized protein n=1 Tax=Microbacterium saccharophilum TaxID=1213358 RepID=A0A5C8I5W6_9MICO|nr:hypothetical protein [Microbacterium saccharophilum]TXK14382.1 hypothetical protein FVP74_07430 [Microbacterium saccharophilum]GEP49269.1 hypothetical protein MSA03_27770 [Microbacterium saccharophilum]
MSLAVVEITHTEIVRRREDQLARVASVRGRSAGVLGASGVAATLVGTIGDNGGFVLAVTCYLFATVYSVKSMAMSTRTGLTARGIIGRLRDADELQARVRITTELVVELEQSEKILTNIGTATTVAMGWFVAGTALTALVTLVSILLSLGVGR